MHRATSNLTKRFYWSAAFALLLCLGWPATASAQEPPLGVSRGGRPTKPTDVLALGGWLLYPTVRGFGLWSDNLFQATTSPLNTSGLGIAPAIVAEASNGIHTTTLYANLERRYYPRHTDFDTFDRTAGFNQRYEAMRDLILTVGGDYSHRTNAAGLISGISAPVGVPTTTLLPNGNTVLPNGNIIDPAGNVVGQTNPALNVAAANNLIVSPNNTFSATASVTKLLNRGILSVSGSILKTEYEKPGSSPDFNAESLRGHGGVWLGPLLYAYSDVSLGWTNFVGTPLSPASKSSSYRAVGGLGTSRIGLMRFSVYGGHQGSEGQSQIAGGGVYGGRLGYEPTPYWTFGATVEQITNIATGTGTSNIAQTIVTPTPVILSIGTSTRTTASFVDTNYSISRQWSVYGRFGYTNIEYLDSPRLDNAWLADVVLRYEIMRNLTMSWEYQYASIVSNVPLASSQKNYVSGSIAYKF
jgi:hypothetical protein